MKQLTIREICIIPGHRGVTIKLHPLLDNDEANTLGMKLAINRLCLVDLIDTNNRILKRYSTWAL